MLEFWGHRVPRYVLCSIICSFGGFIFGMDTGIIGAVTTMEGFISSFGTHSATVHGLIVSAILIPAAFSSCFSGRIADLLGRPKGIAIGALVFGVGAGLEAGAVHISMFVVGRVIEGIGEGLYLGILVVYICEIAPQSIRGPLTSGPQLWITLGLVVGFFTCYGTGGISSSLSWRLPFALLSAFSILFSAASLLWLVPSPRWLTLRGRHDEALEQWDILGVDHAEREKVGPTYTPDIGALDLPRIGTAGVAFKPRFLDLFARDVRTQTILASFIMAMQQLSGIDGVLYYAPLLFQKAGLSSSSASFFASGVSAVLILVFTIPATIFSDRWDRRSSTIYGGLGQFATMLIIGSLYASSSVHPTSGVGRWVVIVCIYIFAVTFAVSWGISGKLYAAEIQPQRTRASATTLAHGSNWVTNFLVALITPVLLDKSSFGVYFLFAGCLLLTVVVCWWFMPETNGKSLEEIQEVFVKRAGGGRVTRMQSLKVEV